MQLISSTLATHVTMTTERRQYVSVVTVHGGDSVCIGNWYGVVRPFEWLMRQDRGVPNRARNAPSTRSSCFLGKCGRLPFTALFRMLGRLEPIPLGPV